MLEKCTDCGSRIIAGGVYFNDRIFCSDKCTAHFKEQIADGLFSEEELAAHVDSVVYGPCPLCGKESVNDLFSAIKVTGMLVAYRIDSGSVFCCASCGRMNRLKAALYCLVAGWWSPTSAFLNVFVLPINLVAIPFTRAPKSPSSELVQQVKVQLVNSRGSEIREAMSKSQEAT